MKVVLKRPGFVAQVLDIDPTMDALRNLLGGEIEVGARPASDIAILIKRLPQGANFSDNERILYYTLSGCAAIVGVTMEGEYTDVPDLEYVVKVYVDATLYRRIDRANNNFRCSSCGHMANFEADGPYENGWNCCPACRKWIVPPEGTENYIAE